MRCAELQIQLTEAVSTLAGQKELVAKLEHDLSTIQALSAVHRPDAEVPPSPRPRACLAELEAWGSVHLLFSSFSKFFFLPFLSSRYFSQQRFARCPCSGEVLAWEGVVPVASRDHPALLLPGQRLGFEVELAVCQS